MRSTLLRGVAVLTLLSAGCDDDHDAGKPRNVVEARADAGSDNAAGPTDAGLVDGTTEAGADAGSDLANGWLTDAGWVDGKAPTALSDGGPPFTLLEFGHRNRVIGARVSGNRALTQDWDGRWNLWNIRDASLVASGQTPRLPDASWPQLGQLRGSTLALPRDTVTQLRNAEDGRVIAEVPASVESLSENGSYLWRRVDNHIDLWAADTGAALAGLDVEADAKVFAAPRELRVATQTPADATGPRIQRFALGSSLPTSTTPYEGNFVAWSFDGDHFLVNGTPLDEGAQKFVGVRALDGSLTGKVLQPPELTLFGGYRDLVVFSRLLVDIDKRETSIYRVASTQNARTYGEPRPMLPGTGLLMVDSPGFGARLTAFDMDAPALTSLTLPPLPLDRDNVTGAFVAIDENVAYPSRERATVYSAAGEPTPLGVGMASIAGSASGRLVLRTNTGPTRVYDLATLPPKLVSSFQSAQDLQVSANGEIVLSGNTTFAASTGTPLHTWGGSPYYYASSSMLSEDGTRLRIASCDGYGKLTTCKTELAAADGSRIFESSAGRSVDGSAALALSPDGMRIAQSFGATHRLLVSQGADVLIDVPAQFLGWLDNGHLLVASYESAAADAKHLGDVELDLSGAVVRSYGGSIPANNTPPVLRERHAVRIDDDWFLLKEQWHHPPAFFEVRATIWSRQKAQPVLSYSADLQTSYGTPIVAGNYVVYMRDTQLVAQRWR